MGRLRSAIRSRHQMEQQKQEASTKNSELNAKLEKYNYAYAACLTGRGLHGKIAPVCAYNAKRRC
jgi:hypothetical protein